MIRRDKISALISMPIFVALLGLASSVQPVLAAGELMPSDALKLLAQSDAIDRTCSFLSGAERDELSDYFAQGEIAAANLIGVDAARTAIREGKLAGNGKSCSSSDEMTVRTTLEAARRAMAEARASAPARPAAKPVSLASAPHQSNDVRGSAAALVTPKALQSSDSELQTYGRFTMAYYVELRCKHLTFSNSREFWNRIVDLHNTTIRARGGDEVSEAMDAAKAAAKNAGGCGKHTLAMVTEAAKTIQKQ